MADITPSDIAFLAQASSYLEAPHYLIKLADAIGAPLKKVAKVVVPKRVAAIGNKALEEAMRLAANSVVRTPSNDDLDLAYRTAGWTGFWHRLATTAAGGVSGAFGLAGLALELPVTTGIMFRSIASIANDFGENLGLPEGRLQCIAVFGYAGPGPTDDAVDASYLTARVAMAALLRDAAKFMTSRGAADVSEALARGMAPALVSFIERVAAQFNVVISQKLMAQSIPLVGIATGATINNVFTGHFNNVARYHFGIRRLERQYGTDAVYAEYRRQLRTVRDDPKRLGPGGPGDPDRQTSEVSKTSEVLETKRLGPGSSGDSRREDTSEQGTS
jgi:hypothetical protein